MTPDTPPNTNKASSWKPYIFFLVIIAGVILNALFGWSDALMQTDALESLKAQIEGHPVLAVVLYLVVMVVACVLLAVPGVVFAIVAGLLFGPWWGTLWCVVAASLGAMLSFLAGRFFLKDALKPRIQKNALLRKLLFENSSENAVLLLAITRLVPLFPYNLQNFAYGITDIKFGTYSIWTFLFLIPGTAMYTIAAAGLVDPEQGTLYVGIASALLLAVVAASFLLRRRMGRQTGVK